MIQQIELLIQADKYIYFTFVIVNSIFSTAFFRLCSHKLFPSAILTPSFLSFSKSSRILRSMDFLLNSGNLQLKSSIIFYLLSNEPCISFTSSTSLLFSNLAILEVALFYFSSSTGSTRGFNRSGNLRKRGNATALYNSKQVFKPDFLFTYSSVQTYDLRFCAMISR